MGHIQWIIDIYQQIDAHEGETSDVFVTAHGGRLGMRGWGDGGGVVWTPFPPKGGVTPLPQKAPEKI